jgi:hypothetical protein
MAAQFLTLRLSETEAELISRLQARTALSKSDLVKRALQALDRESGDAKGGGLFALGEARFGRHGDAKRQSADIKSVVRGRLDAKRTGR